MPPMPSPMTQPTRSLAITLALVVAAHQQAGVHAEEPLTRIADVRSLPTAALVSNPEVRIRGVVTRARQSSLFVQDESAGIYVNIARSLIRGVMAHEYPRPAVPLGSEVEIAGVADPGGYSPIILPRTLTVLGPRPLPDPPPMDPEAFFEGIADSQFIETTGLVEEVVEFEDHWRLSLDYHSRPFLASIVKTAVTGHPGDLVNATVRVRGPTSSMSNTRGEFLLPWVFVEESNCLEVVTPRPHAPFESPTIPLQGLGQFHTTATRGGMVRTEGTVIHVVPGEQVYLQDAACGLRVTARSTDGLEVGDRVEVAGFVRRDGHVAGLAHGIFRSLGRGSPPEPFAVTPEKIEEVNINAVNASVSAVPSDYDGCLVRFPARFVDYQAEKYWGTLVLSTGSTTVTAKVSPETMSQLAAIPLGSEIAVTGIAKMAWEFDPLAWPNRKPRQLSLIVRSDSDIAILRQPSPWTARRLGTLLSVVMAALTVTLAWGWSLRRKRGELEGLVSDRTRELTAAREREVRQEDQMRFVLQSKLKASLAAAAVAHEINQPLSRILLKSRMELEAGGDGSESLRSIVSDADRVVTTIEKMRVLLRNVETQHEEVDLAQVARSSLFQVKSLLGTSGVTVRQSSPPAGCRIQGDAVQLQLAIVNLLRNAVEAIAAGGLPRREIEVVIGETPEAATLTVGDSGPGWTGGTLDDALVATTKPAGAGVGLFVVQTAVENHHGSITVGRSPLGGAEFRIVLPRA